MTLLTQYVCRDHRRQSVPSLIVFCCLAATATFLITGGMARATEVEFLFAFGTQGTGNGQFTFPYGIAVGNSGNIYVTDTEQHRVQVFDSDGNFQSAFGSTGTAEGDFDGPTEIAVGNGAISTWQIRITGACRYSTAAATLNPRLVALGSETVNFRGLPQSPLLSTAIST